MIKIEDDQSHFDLIKNQFSEINHQESQEKVLVTDDFMQSEKPSIIQQNEESTASKVEVINIHKILGDGDVSENQIMNLSVETNQILNPNKISVEEESHESDSLQMPRTDSESKDQIAQPLQLTAKDDSIHRTQLRDMVNNEVSSQAPTPNPQSRYKNVGHKEIERLGVLQEKQADTLFGKLRNKHQRLGMRNRKQVEGTPGLADEGFGGHILQAEQKIML